MKSLREPPPLPSRDRCSSDVIHDAWMPPAPSALDGMRLPLPLPARIADLRERIGRRRTEIAALDSVFRRLDQIFRGHVDAVQSAPWDFEGIAGSRHIRNYAGWVDSRRDAVAAHMRGLCRLLKELARIEEAHAQTYKRISLAAGSAGRLALAGKARALGALHYRSGASAAAEAKAIRHRLASATFEIPVDPRQSIGLHRVERIERTAVSLSNPKI